MRQSPPPAHNLKRTGRAAVILPLGVLFRGNAEGAIRKAIADKRLVEGIIAFPPNIFFGTGIPACALVLAKTGAATRSGIFMIDVSKPIPDHRAKCAFLHDGKRIELEVAFCRNAFLPALSRPPATALCFKSERRTRRMEKS